MAPWLVGHHSDRHTWLRCHTLCHIRYVITLRRHSPYGRRTEYHLLAGHHSVMSHYPPFFRNWPTISKISQLLFSLHLIQTDERKRTKTFVLLIKTSLGGNALCIFRGGARSTGRLVWLGVPSASSRAWPGSRCQGVLVPMWTCCLCSVTSVCLVHLQVGLT